MGHDVRKNAVRKAIQVIFLIVKIIVKAPKKKEEEKMELAMILIRGQVIVLKMTRKRIIKVIEDQEEVMAIVTPMMMEMGMTVMKVMKMNLMIMLQAPVALPTGDVIGDIKTTILLSNAELTEGRTDLRNVKICLITDKRSWDR